MSTPHVLTNYLQTTLQKTYAHILTMVEVPQIHKHFASCQESSTIYAQNTLN